MHYKKTANIAGISAVPRLITFLGKLRFYVVTR